jgi:hypothetical protein
MMQLITSQNTKMSLLIRPPRNFPNSLLREIFNILAAARDKHVRQAQGVPMPRDAIECIRALSALVCVSRLFNQLALPFLYSTIVFSRDTHHRLLFRALRQNRSRGRLVKSMTVFELRDYPTRENSAFPALVDNKLGHPCNRPPRG